VYELGKNTVMHGSRGRWKEIENVTIVNLLIDSTLRAIEGKSKIRVRGYEYKIISSAKTLLQEYQGRETDFILQRVDDMKEDIRMRDADGMKVL